MSGWRKSSDPHRRCPPRNCAALLFDPINQNPKVLWVIDLNRWRGCHVIRDLWEACWVGGNLRILISGAAKKLRCSPIRSTDFVFRSDDKVLIFLQLFPSMDLERCLQIYFDILFDLANSSAGEKYRSIIDGAVLSRGATLTRILITSLTGVFPPSQLDEVNFNKAAESLTEAVITTGQKKVDLSRLIVVAG